jgi:hypothetical protein
MHGIGLGTKIDGFQDFPKAKVHTNLKEHEIGLGTKIHRFQDFAEAKVQSKYTPRIIKSYP